MYEKYWGLSEKPFENTPDPRFMYYSKKHEEALTRLLYAVKEEKGAAMLTGEYGSGKTVLSRILIDELIKNKIYEVALIIHPQLNPLEFMQEIIYQLKNEHVEGSKPKLLHMLQDSIYKNFREEKKTVVLIDEAQIIRNQETFEEVRLFLNFQLNNKFLITLILIGQPELLRKINAIPQLEQRLGIKYHLTGLDDKETQEYIKHRLEVARAQREIFTKEALEIIYQYSKGLPRKINNICDLSLLIGFGSEAKEIGKELAEKVAADLNKKDYAYAKDV
ncbi:MAG: AAA family ATPase [Candidatus Omnitrophica bacterium]|nr:AAA family ATPase [Candidatus Omnitrophota bacterium]MDD5237707.1 AAA family ATPase [Candidatus Omnitrophota bacterium]